ncbi:Hypothetical protein NTJ_13814 [Nesidiocoris tenuis]|uniref:Uncharacterized protein n=1 Tax=Nesidiocoris tenuis TaxID=355587 RepID=A0ABN7BBF7_9HEMI|nr:Hypothetical protein NTJ_13814 [Nesidiocoris tenuis]
MRLLITIPSLWQHEAPRILGAYVKSARFCMQGRYPGQSSRIVPWLQNVTKSPPTGRPSRISKQSLSAKFFA